MSFFEWNIRHSSIPLSEAMKSLSFPEFILDIAKNRGMCTYSDFMEFAYPQALSLSSPFLLIDVDLAVERIRLAIDQDEKMLIFGDKDADGVTATTIMYRIIRKFGGNVSYRVPEGITHYGLSKAVLDDAKSAGISLIITVDCGITAIEESLYAKEIGIDLILTDHHEPLDTLPQALALVNPKLNNYQFPYLSGSGVALKVAQAIAESYVVDNYNQELIFFDFETSGLNPEEDEIIEIAAIRSKNGIVSDTFQCFVSFDGSLDSQIVNLTGITDDILKEKGIPLKKALETFITFIGSETLVGHNILGFDMKFLKIHADRQLNKNIENTVIDTFPLSKGIYKSLKSYSLSVIGQHLGIFIDETKLHRAINDVHLNAEVYRRMTLSQCRPVLNIISELVLLSAIGTVADIMPLIKENRVIVRLGLLDENILRAPIGLITLLKRLNIIDTLDSKSIGWTLGPIINSPGRMGQASLTLSLLTTDDPEVAEQLTTEILSKDQERKDLVSSLGKEILASTNLEQIDKNKFLFICSSNISRGLTGLIATKLSNEFQVPVIVISIIDENEASGSVRSTGTFDVVKFLQSLSDLFAQFGGHTSAGGFVIPIEKIAELEKRIQLYMLSYEKDTLRNSLDIDSELPDLSLLSVKNVTYIKTLFNPVGHKNPHPNFLIKDVSLVQKKYIGKDKNHLLLTFQKGQKSFTAIAWSFAARWEAISKHSRFDIVGIPEVNIWNNNSEVRIQVLDVKGK